LGRLRSDLIRLGSHSVSHPRLGRLEKTALDTELTASRRALEGLGQEPVAMLALPYGSYARDVLEAASHAGYERVFANVPVAGERAGNSRLVGRVDVSPQDWPLEFKLKATGAYEWMSFALPVKRAIVGALSPQNAS
jgi:peptidoglycan/xylan/chitin deacetylase (PgdA/CDA1 family)